MRIAALLPLSACGLSLCAAVPKLETRLQPVAGLEENRGQAPPEFRYLWRSSLRINARGCPYSGELPLFEFLESNSAPAATATGLLAGLVNVVKGNEPSKWITGIRRYREVRFSQVYPGIDAAYRMEDAGAYPELRLAWLVSAGAEIGAIRLKAQAAVRMGYRLAASQAGGNGRVTVPIEWRVTGADELGFAVAAYDRSRELVIEVTIGTGLGALGGDYHIDRTGAVITTGRTPAVPETVQPGTAPDGDVCGRITTRGAATLIPCNDAYVAKYNAGGALEYLTYLGGSANDGGEQAATDQGGAVWLVGVTNSANFPVTPDASQPAFAGPAGVLETMSPHLDGDLFVTKLGPAGVPIYSTYFGGSGREYLGYGDELLVDAAGSVVLAGYGRSGLPVTPEAYRKTSCELCSFAAKWSSQGRLLYVTYIPGQGFAYDVDAAGALYFAGAARADAPATPGAYRTSYGGGNTDGYIGKLNAAGTGLAYATFVSGGGDAYDAASQIAVDSKGNAWFTCCGFLGKLDASGSTLLVRLENAGGQLAVDRQDNLHLAGSGYGGAPAFTPTGAITSLCGTSFYAKLDSQGTLQYFESSELRWDLLGFDASGRPVVLANPSQPSPDWGTRLWALDLSDAPRRWLACLADSASLAGPNAVAPGEIVSLLGSGLGPESGAEFRLDSEGRVPRQLAGTRVLFDGVAAPVLFAQHSQVNAIAPFSLTPGKNVRLELEFDGSRFELPVRVIDSRPAFFTTSGSGRGQAAALNQDGSANSSTRPARRGSVISLFLTGTGQTEPAMREGEVARGAGTVLLKPFQVGLLHAPGYTPLQIEYAGVAPGLLTSVTQLNVRLPEAVPPSTFPLLATPLVVLAGGQFLYQYAEIAIE